MNRSDALVLANAARQGQASQRRKLALDMHAKGRTPAFIARLLGVSADQVRRYIREAREHDGG